MNTHTFRRSTVLSQDREPVHSYRTRTTYYFALLVKCIVLFSSCLGLFAKKLRNMTLSLVMPVLLQPDGFFFYFLFGRSIEICRHILIEVKVGQSNGHFTGRFT